MISVTVVHVVTAVVVIALQVSAIALASARRRPTKQHISGSIVFIALVGVAILLATRQCVRAVNIEHATTLRSGSVSGLDQASVLALVTIQAVWVYVVGRILTLGGARKLIAYAAAAALAVLSALLIVLQYARMLNIQGKLSL